MALNFSLIGNVVSLLNALKMHMRLVSLISTRKVTSYSSQIKVSFHQSVNSIGNYGCKVSLTSDIQDVLEGAEGTVYKQA